MIFVAPLPKILATPLLTVPSIIYTRYDPGAYLPSQAERNSIAVLPHSQVNIGRESILL